MQRILLYASGIVAILFCDAVDDDRRQVLEESRIGGHGYWIQNGFGDFVAQIVEDEQAELSFGDAGSLYIFGRSPNELAAIVQSH